MITEQALQEAIAECEGQRNPTSNTCLKLAAFYIIRDNLFPKDNEPKFYSKQSMEQKMNEIVEHKKNESEFRQAIVGIDTNEVINIMDELMDTLKIISPKLYNGVIRKLSIKN